ncbi:unnamed protein product [Pelagomonas calceolata]|uniref:Uncharacterized protein n=1 Tax=Pelagomonas calceolata TaxID=35677 RepID=A0A8J2X1V4_9STRA|nr:unnamed protein product [Pelagomonas calceolata]
MAADSDDESPLHKAAFDRDPKALRQLLSQGAVDPNFSPNQRDGKFGRTPLHELCKNYSRGHRHKERSVICFELLRAAGADVNARENPTTQALQDGYIGGRRPLHWAAGNSARQHLVQRLIASGAHVDAVSDDGRTPLHHAARAGCADAACLLIRAGAEVNLRDSCLPHCFSGYTPLEAAVAWSENVKAFPILLRAGATLPDLRTDWALYEETEPRARWYIERVEDEGGFANLARLHLNKLTETFVPKFAGRLPPEIVRHVVSFWLHAGYYDEGGERVDEAKYDSLVADITRKVDEMASLKVVPRASRRARKLRHALEADLDSDDDWTAGS